MSGLSRPVYLWSNMPDELRVDEDRTRNQFHIVGNIHDLMTKTLKQSENYIQQLIAQALRNLILTHYADLQKQVDAAIFSPETRKVIENLIQEKIKLEIDQHIKDMFGRE